MSAEPTLEQLLQLPAEERLALAEALWNPLWNQRIC
jgi:hypothetical protein